MLGIAGVFFGILVGWIIGTQQVPPPRQAAAAPEPQAPAQSQGPPPLDQSRVAALQESANSSPRDPAPRIELGNLYFDSERFADAARWYEAALGLEPRNVNVSTDLGIAYYYMNQPDRALEQFDRSMKIDPRHTKTLLNIGIVRAFGKQDLDGASKAWQRVVEIAPGSPEADRARQALESLRSAHPASGGTGGSSPQTRPE